MWNFRNSRAGCQTNHEDAGCSKKKEPPRATIKRHSGATLGRERETEKEKESYIYIILREGERVRARDMRERERHRERERDGDGRREGERGREENRGSVRAGERRGR